MTLLAQTDCVPSRLLQLRREERRTIFHLKSDLSCSDGYLRELKALAQDVMQERLPAVATLIKQQGFAGTVASLSAGSYHVVHSITSGALPHFVVRSTLPGLFAEDRGLLLEGLVRSCLDRLSMGYLVPQTKSVGFRVGGAPFDFAVLEFAPGIVLRDLGDPILDEDGSYLEALGKALRSVHHVAADGAGLVDCDVDAPLERPRGVLDTWPDYIMLNLERHLDACQRAGYIDATLAARIVRQFDLAQPLLQNRPMRLLHGDPGTHNVVVDLKTKRVTALIDWEDTLVGDPLFEIAMVSSFQPVRRMAAFMTGYGLERPSIEDNRLIALYFLRIALCKTVHRLRFDISDRPGRIPGHHRIYRGVDELERLLK